MSRTSFSISYLRARYGLRISLVLLLLVWGRAVVRAQEGGSCTPTSCPYQGTCYNGEGMEGGTPADPCMYPDNGGCPPDYTFTGDGCCIDYESPIIIDLSGGGFHLSSAAGGVWYTIYPKRTAQYQVAWPEQGSQNGWLVLDRNGNGVIDNFSEFFGNLTPQPRPVAGKPKNGFAALAVYDAPEQGRNGDGWISKEDAIFSKLRIWVDLNHDGISQPNELFTLEQVGIAAISLDYQLSKFVDSNGDVFRCRSVIRDAQGGEASKVIYDVYVEIGASRSTGQNSVTANDWPVVPSAGFK